MLATRSGEIAAQPRELARIAAAAVVIHSLAAQTASSGGPFLMDQLVTAIPSVIRTLLSR
jgi:NAD(P)H-hydrate repair Nnr-like enzyme with NAD(P)H-hydrate dehydratase domain